jgi:hypothetical protein
MLGKIFYQNFRSATSANAKIAGALKITIKKVFNKSHLIPLGTFFSREVGYLTVCNYLMEVLVLLL